jgi:class 3 adenylate cyclase/tetratricopeptide (TPR) repeat protein
MTCPRCGATNDESALTCAACGLELARQCANCGARNPGTARFCMNCGVPLTDAPRPAPVEQEAAAASGTRGPRSAAGMRRRGLSLASADSPATATNFAEPAETSEERRIVTVLFADIANSTPLADVLDPEELRGLLSAFFAAMSREIHRHGGTVEKYIGDAIMAVFGLPTAHEDDPIRALRAALAMRRALARFNDERRAADPAATLLQMRIGVNTGEVVAASGTVDADGRDFLVTGDAVNVAARLEQEAAPDAIVVGARTYRATSGAVRYRALQPVAARGKAKPVPAWAALEMVDQSPVPAPRPRGLDGSQPPLVGREQEMDLLRTVFARAVGERRPHAVTVLGVPGIGKTRLVREFVTGLTEDAGAGGAASNSQPPDGMASDVPLVLESRCPPYGEGITYWPLADILRKYCGLASLGSADRERDVLLANVRHALRSARRGEDAITIAAYLGHTIGIETPERRQALLPTDAQQLREGLFRAWRVFFEALATMRPLVLLIDDIHWADDALLDLLATIPSRLGGAALLLLTPARPELRDRRPEWGGGQPNEITLELEPLSDVACAQLVNMLLPGAGVPDSLRSGILAKAEGNPFYVEEIIRMLADRGILVLEDGSGAGTNDPADDRCGWKVAEGWETSSEVVDPVIPDTVQGVLAARLDLLAPTERALLQHASIIGRQFWSSALSALATSMSRKAIESQIAPLVRKGMVQPSDHVSSLVPAGESVYTFRHALTREVTYATIPRSRRANEHARLAAWLEQRARGKSDTFVELIAHHYLEFYRQASHTDPRSIARRIAVRAKVIHYLEEAGTVAMARHALVKADQYFSDALEVATDALAAPSAPLQVALLMQRGDVRSLMTQGDDAWTDYREALRLWLEVGAHVPPIDSAGDTTGDTTRDQERLGVEWQRRGLALYRHLVLLPTRWAGWFRDPPAHEDIRAYLQAGLALAERLGQRDTADYAALLTAKTFFWWSWSEQRGEYELLDALRAAREAVGITEHLGDALGASAALDALGNMQATTTDLRGFLESQTRRLEWGRQIDDPNELVDMHAEVSSAHQLVGDFPLAVEHAQIARDIADEADSDVLRLQALQRLAVAHFESDQWDATIAGGKSLLEVLYRVSIRHSDRMRWALLAVAIAHALRGEEADAGRYVRLVHPVADAHETQYVGLYWARFALARGDWEEAQRLMLRALTYEPGRLILAALHSDIAELAARTNNHQLFERYGAEALELGWRSGARKALAQAIRARAIVALQSDHLEDAQADLTNALKRYTDLGTEWEVARTHYLQAAALRRTQPPHDQSVRNELAQAARTFERLGAMADAVRARAALAGGEVRLI